MKRILVAVPVFILTYTTYAQCSVSTRDEDDWLIFDNQNEELYRNEDLENGAFMISGKISLFFNKTDKSAQFQLMLFTIVNGGKKEIVPRELTISYGSAGSISLTAERSEGPIMQAGGRLSSYTYMLPKGDDYVKLRDGSFVSMMIKDTRTGVTFTFTPYSGIVKEQIGCITKMVERR